ncbi:TRAP transporter small permease subunit [Microbacterium sp. NPDC096154]|uniref:TRAP transporter small permease n=1 Tax=Microbacterium sp. NPDC096154 TaxID=3155549 RepID=UPI003319755A
MKTTPLTRGLDRAFAWVGGIALVALMLHTVANALSRYLGGRPIEYSTEIIAGYYLPTLVLMGILLAHLRREHTSADLLTAKLTPAGQKALAIVAEVLVSVLAIGIAVFSAQEGMHAMSINQVYGVTDVPIWPIKLLIPLSFALYAVLAIATLVATIRHGVPVQPHDDVQPHEEEEVVA